MNINHEEKRRRIEIGLDAIKVYNKKGLRLAVKHLSRTYGYTIQGAATLLKELRKGVSNEKK